MARAIKVSIKGDRALQRQLRAMSKDLVQAALPAVDDAARSAFAQSQAKVPVDSGALKASGSVQAAEVRHGDVAFATVEYSHPHAAHVHEGVVYGQPVAAPPKFLRDGAKAVRSTFRSTLKKLLKSFLTTKTRSK